MYSGLLHAHSGLRWLILALAILIVLKSLVGLFGGGKYSKFDKITSSAFVGTLDLQFLIGIVLYFISPLAKQARDAGFSRMMAEPQLRMWGIEHLVIMIIALALAHVGKSIVKKAEDDSVKFRFQSVFFGVALLLMLLGIPWDRV